MMADRPNQRRARKVAGRSASRVELSERAQERSQSTAGAGNAEAARSHEAPSRAAARSVGLRKPTDGESGVDRKRRRIDAEREVAERERSLTDVEPDANDTRGTVRLAAIFAAIAVVLGAIAAVLAFHPGADVSDNKAYVDQEGTEKVLSQARSVACAPFQYKYQNIDHWLTEAQSKLSGSAREQFQTFLGTNKKAIEDTKSSSDCRVDTIGLMDLTHDRATLLTSMQIDTTREGQLVESNSPKSVMVMVRDGDQWLLDQFIDP